MRKRQPTYFIILILTLFLAACTNSEAKEIQNTPVKKLDLAFVEDISVSQVSVDEIKLIAHGRLTNSCSKIEKFDIEHADGAIVVSIFTSQTINTDCGSDPVDFNEEIIIELDNSQGSSNMIIVNGINTTIDIPKLGNPGDDVHNTPSPTQDSQTTVSDEVEEKDQTRIQDNQPYTQTIQTAAETTQPTTPIVTDVTSEQSTTETESSPSGEIAITADVPSEQDQQPEQCLDKAAFYADVTVPDNTLFKPGEKFKKVWRVRNEGTCIWNDAYSLIFASGEIMNGSLSNQLTEVAPGEISEISIELQAPARWGQYTGNWQFQNDQGVRFGVGAGGHDYIWVQIFVDSPAPAPPSHPPADPPTDQPSQSNLPTQAGCDAQRNDSYEQQVLGLINNGRSSQGLNTLNLQSQLVNAAFRHSSDMACHDFIGHSGSDASSWYDRVSAQGYANYNSARENIYVGDPQFGGTPEGAYDWWMNSQVHRDNILNPDIAEIGIGYTYNSNSSYGGYYTVVFARP
jgi:uncharacterized protein YkwD